jgi:hypothetical protein
VRYANRLWTILLYGALAGVAFAQSVPATPAAGDPSLRPDVLKQFPPKKIKAHGPQHILRFEDIDRRLADVAAWMEQRQAALPDPEAPKGTPVSVSFAELFQPARTDALFPLTNSVVRWVPESSLAGLPVYDSTGTPMGSFSNKYPFTRSGTQSYTLWFFQYQASDGHLRRTGPDLLLERFSVRWLDVADKPCLVIGWAEATLNR